MSRGDNVTVVHLTPADVILIDATAGFDITYGPTRQSAEVRVLGPGIISIQKGEGEKANVQP